MKALSAGLAFFAATSVAGVLLGLMAGGLGPFPAWFALLPGFTAAGGAFWGTADPASPERSDGAAPNESRAPWQIRYGSFWFWAVAVIFTLFAVRSFCWVLYIQGPDLKIQSPNNLGDLALHLTYIKDFANGSPLWPLNPIYPYGHLRYPAGVDFFNGLLMAAGVDLIRGLVWVGLAGSLATFYALYRWGKTFTVAGFLFNGGTIGFLFLQERVFQDYQGGDTIAWKSIPLSMFVTQRGWLYAIPAGLILLWHWREKFFRSPNERARGPLPFWVELLLYSSMPFFHFHTFLALSLVLLTLFVCGSPAMRGNVLTLVASAAVPATLFVALITDGFKAGSVVEWKPGWVLGDARFGRSNFLIFWWHNFGILIPLVVLMLVLAGIEAWKSKLSLARKLPEDVTFFVPAFVIVVLCLLVKFAPWEWDNLKLMIWAYFLFLPYLWRNLLSKWSIPIRVGVCIALFGSGFVSLFGGLKAGDYGICNRAEVDAVGAFTGKLPVTARYATWPTYNHPILLQGHNAVLGYPGHLWTQGFSNYTKEEQLLRNLMMGTGDWRGAAAQLNARYIFWGREERQNYAQSSRPWEAVLKPVATGTWGSIYDLGEPPDRR